ncbi:MAG: cytochrome c oxidase subunit 3 [Bacteroidota bacterium]
MEIQNSEAVGDLRQNLSMNPKKFLLWLGIVSIIMMFAAFTSAYLVRRAEGNWLEFEIPKIFTYSTIVLVLSSISMHLAYWASKKDRFLLLRLAISITFVLGIIFLVMQVLGWGELTRNNVFLVGNPSGSFFYVLSGLHGLHIISALLVLIFAMVASFQLKIHAKRLNQIEMCVTYWHFLDLLWLYLFIFLLYNN